MTITEKVNFIIADIRPGIYWVYEPNVFGSEPVLVHVYVGTNTGGTFVTSIGYKEDAPSEQVNTSLDNFIRLAPSVQWQEVVPPKF